MSLSKELQAGKAAEHLVCFDLIQKGFNAFLADQGLPFDVLVESGGILKRIQVKSTGGLHTYGKSIDVYRFGTRSGKGGAARVKRPESDYYAFVALDSKKIAYIPIDQMTTPDGGVKQTVDFKTRDVKYTGRIYPNGTVRTPEWGKFFEDYSEFSLQ